MKKAVLIALAVMLAVPGLAKAEFDYEEGASFIILNLGYALAKSQESNNTLNMWGFDVLFERVVTGGEHGIGISLGYYGAEDEFTTSAGKTKQTYVTTPAFVTYRWLFGGGEKFRGYVGGGLGIGLHSRETSVDGVSLFKDRNSGIALAGAAGADLSISKAVFLGLGYKLTWYGNSFFENDITNTFNIAVGFRIQ